MEEDAVVQTAWCAVCFRSSDVKWKKHVFTRNHQNKARDFLRRRVELVDACLKQPKSATATSAELRSVSWKCVFCELPGQQGWLDWVEHSAGEAHRKRVEAFCRHHRCDTDRASRERVCLSTALYRQLRADYAAIEARERQAQAAVEEISNKPEESEQSRQTAARTEAFLGAAASRLSQRQSQPQPVVDQPTTPALGMGPPLKTAKTVESADGVLQNPLGRHEGQRVWGGGIVKLRKEEWVPWPIDTLVQEELARQFESSTLQDDGAVFTHRLTGRAIGHGLQQIAPVAWGEQVRNIHTGAVPPWMVQSEDEYKQSNERPIAPIQPIAPVRSNEKMTLSALSREAGREPTRRKRDIFSKLQESAPDASYGPDWLPKFSGIWQDNQRSSVKRSLQELKRASRTTKPAPAPLLPAEKPVAMSSPLTQSLPAATTLPAPDPALAATDAGPKDPPAPVAQVVQTTSLDAKKELLLAQKERLRAKLAAKRRP